MGRKFPLPHCPARRLILAKCLTLAVFIASNCCFFAGPVAAQRNGIALPPPPVAKPPPKPASRDSDQDEASEAEIYEQNRLERQRYRDQRDKPAANAPKKEAISQRELAKEMLKSRPQQYGFEVSLLIPGILTSGPRKDYTTEVTSHFNYFARTGAVPNKGDVDLWYGVRLAPFAGTGTYDEIPGRYGYFYFGPTIGIGSLDQPPQEIGGSEAGNINWLSFKFIEQTGWLLTAGLMAQSRNGRTDPGNEEPSDDLDSKGIAFDAPGLVVEIRTFAIHYGALSTSLQGGAQFGNGKTFLYAGFGVAGWY